MSRTYKFKFDKTIYFRPRIKTLQEALDQAAFHPHTPIQKRMTIRAEAAGKVWGCCPGQGYGHEGCIFKR